MKDDLQLEINKVINDLYYLSLRTPIEWQTIEKAIKPYSLKLGLTEEKTSEWVLSIVKWLYDSYATLAQYHSFLEQGRPYKNLPRYLIQGINKLQLSSRIQEQIIHTPIVYIPLNTLRKFRGCERPYTDLNVVFLQPRPVIVIYKSLKCYSQTIRGRILLAHEMAHIIQSLTYQDYHDHYNNEITQLQIESQAWEIAERMTGSKTPLTKMVCLNSHKKFSERLTALAVL